MGGDSEFEGGPTHVLPTDPALRTPSVELTVVDGPDRGRRVRLTQATSRVGAAKGNALVLSDPTVSRLHCEIAVGPEGITLRDGGSTNGTFVDGRRIRDIDVGAGTLVGVGATTFRVDVGPEPAFVALSEGHGFGEVLGASAAMRRIYAVLEKAAVTDTTVLITGETGTGKELVAQALHEASRRAQGPFCTIDCGAIPETLMESELFGHVRGAFSGATADRKGIFEASEGGTVFLDEVGELPLTMQPKLLRALESRQVRRIGTNQSRRVDVRVVAATNRSLARSVNQGSFREDLYYRLAVIEVELPPLRARREDIPALAAHFIERFSGQAEPLPPALLSGLLGRDWPGNVRELRNVIERCVSLGFPETAGAAAAPASGPAGAAGQVPVHLPLKEARLAWTEQFESVYVRALLERTGGNVTRAAALAGVTRRFFQRTMARVGVRSAAVAG
ncbi:MAG: sigma 54-interacting transcriptional regulator, partial [Polyangiaceae bacterium]